MNRMNRRMWDRDIDLLEQDPIPHWREELGDPATDDPDWVIRDVPAEPAGPRHAGDPVGRDGR